MSGLTKLVGHKILDYPTHLILNAMTPTPPKRRLGDIADQTATEGGARPIIWGRVRPIGGNIIQLQSPQRRMIKEKAQGGGKGGGKQKKQKVEHVYRTYAIGICEGPVSGVTRVWRNNKLVYDARGNDWGARNNPVFLSGFRLYLGRYDQQPDPTLEAIWGIGNVPAYRGTCYMVAVDEDLSELSGAVPQWLFEVERAEFFDIESDLYPISEVEGLNTGAALKGGEFKLPPQWRESLTNSATLESGELKSILREQEAAHETLTNSAELIDGELKSILQKLTIEHEQLNNSATLESGELKAILINANPFTENITTGATLTGGSLQ